MNDLEDKIWRELEGQLCDVPLTLLAFATRQGIVDRLAPRIAAAIEAAIGPPEGRRVHAYTLREAALAALRASLPTPEENE